MPFPRTLSLSLAWLGLLLLVPADADSFVENSILTSHKYAQLQDQGLKPFYTLSRYQVPRWGHLGSQDSGCPKVQGCPTVSNVSVLSADSASALRAILATAKGGEVIELAAGDYGALTIKTAFAAPVTIVSADPGHQARFSGLTMTGAENVTFDGVTFDYSFKSSDAPTWYRPFSITNSTDITIRNAVFDGDTASGTGTVSDGASAAIGLMVSGGSGITVADSTFYQFYRGAFFSHSDDITFTGNDISGIRSDGLNLTGIQGALIAGNYIHDFKAAVGSKDHKDMIQVHSANADRPTTDLTIRDNVLDMGAGSVTQSIWMRNEVMDAGGDASMRYQNIVIENNLIRNGQIHGIAIGQTDGLTIRNNLLVTGEGSDLYAPKIAFNADSTNVTVEDNVAGGFRFPTLQSGWTLTNNLTLQQDSRNTPGYYDSLFDNIRAGTDSGADSLPATPDTGTATVPSDRGGLLIESPSDGLKALVRITATNLNNVFQGDASESLGLGGTAPESGITYRWDFGDGTKATGIQVTHSYASAGHFDITLQLESADGQIDATTSGVDIAGPEVLSFGNDQDTLFSHLSGTATALEQSLPLVRLEDGSNAIQMTNGTGTHIALAKSATEAIWGAEGFSLHASLRSPEGSLNAGNLIRVHGSFTVRIDTKGNLITEITPEGTDTPVRLIAYGTGLNNGFWHDIDVSWNGTDGDFVVAVDDTVRAQTTLLGEMKPQESWGLTLGSAWNTNFTGQIRSLELMAEPQKYDFSLVIAPPSEPQAPNSEIPPQEILFDMPAQDEFQFDAFLTADRATNIHLNTETGDVRLGRIQALEDTQNLGLKLDFSRTSAQTDRGQLVWNHGRLGVELVDDRLKIFVGDAAGGMHGSFSDRIGLNDANSHQLFLTVDAEADILKAFVDGTLVLEETGVDFNLVDIGRERGWYIGNQWSDRQVDVVVSDFQLVDFNAAHPLAQDLLALA